MAIITTKLKSYQNNFMSFQMDLELTLFSFEFRECKGKTNLNFLKLSDNDYLLIKVFEKSETVDLFFAQFAIEDNPCDSDPYFEKTIKLGFSLKDDKQILRQFIDKYEKE